MMKKTLALLLSLLLVSTMLVGMLIPAAADGVYTATFESKTYRATAENADGARSYYLTISTNAPAEVKALVTYTMNGEAFNGVSAPGTYTITANLPAGYFVDGAGNEITSLTATLTLTQTKQDLAVIVFESNGAEAYAYAELKDVTVPEAQLKPSSLFKKLADYKVLSFSIKEGTAGAKYLLRISVDPSLYAVKDLTEKDIYLYEDGKLVSLTDKGYKVELKDGRYEISNVAADAQMTLIMKVDRCAFPWWIIVILCVVALLVCMYFVGRAKTKREEQAAAAATKEEEKPAEEKPAESSDETPKNE